MQVVMTWSRIILEVASMVVTSWIVAFLANVGANVYVSEINFPAFTEMFRKECPSIIRIHMLSLRNTAVHKCKKIYLQKLVYLYIVPYFLFHALTTILLYIIHKEKESR